VGAVCNNAVTIQRVERFRAILGGDEGKRSTLELPFDAKARFGTARAPVRGTRWISGAKHEETRERRVRKAVAMLRDGQQHP
jgi:hypothetical protein